MTPTGSASPRIAQDDPLHPVKGQSKGADPARRRTLSPALRIENMFGRLKDWRHIHTRYDRCVRTFMSAICIAATVIFWINQ
ncbi:transposase [Mesorhizobium sp. LNHC221B00]|nr:transposase [Mesorhizobium sp. LNHC221B00]